MHTIINRAGWLVAGVLALFVVAAMTGVVSGGPLDPSGPPSSTLPQVEPRSPIPPVGWNGAFPIVISQPGSYFLTRSLNDGSTGTDGIRSNTPFRRRRCEISLPWRAPAPSQSLSAFTTARMLNSRRDANQGVSNSSSAIAKASLISQIGA